MTQRPKIKLELEPFDRIMEILGFIGLALLIVVPMYYFDQLPDQIPKHYGANGEPDGFGSKNILWALPIMGIVMFIGLFWINKYPHTFNYTQKVTESNAKILYQNTTRMIRLLNVIITWAFSYITYATIQITLGNQNGLGSTFTPIFLILIFGVVVYYFYKMKGKK